MKYLKRRKKNPLWLVILADAAMVGVILVAFAFFHHVLPKITAEYQLRQMLANATEPSEREPEITEAPPTTEPDETEEITEPVETTEPDPRTPWQIKFEEHFSEEPVLTYTSYKSPEVSITIDKVRTSINGNPVTYYLADIYIASIDNFKTYTAYGDVVYFGAQNPVGMSKATNAIIGINGDYMTVQKEGFLVRNSVVYASDRNNSICVLYPDGSMEAYDQGTYEIDDILAREPLQVWSFGPSLLDENGKVKEEYDMLSGVVGIHPRTAVGYYEPGHYCFLVVDGRQKHSLGMRMNQLAQIFEDLGCSMAYNMDGGASSVMLFDDHVINMQSASRDLGDILLITDSYYNATMIPLEALQ